MEYFAVGIVIKHIEGESIVKFLELRQGFSVSIDEIEGIQYKDELHSTIITHHNSFTADFPYKVLLEMLEAREIMDKPDNSPILDKLDVLAKSAQTFAG